MLSVYMDAEDEQLLEDEVAVATDSKRSVHCSTQLMISELLSSNSSVSF